LAGKCRVAVAGGETNGIAHGVHQVPIRHPRRAR
jgi:hypothetical protein